MQPKKKDLDSRQSFILPNLGDNIGFLSDLITEMHEKDDPNSPELQQVNPQKLVGKLIITIDEKGNRQIDRVENSLSDEIQTEKLKSQLNRIAKQHRISVDEVCDLYVAVSGDFDALKKNLRGQDVKMWTDEEDEALYLPATSKPYKDLLRERGAEELNMRKQFLELHNYF